MRIFLVSDSKTGINFFPELEAILRKKVADLEVETIFVPFPEDVPAAVNSAVGEADLVFVFVLYEELDFKVRALLSKLIDIEMKGGAIIVKAVGESDLPQDSRELEAEKERLAEKWSAFILDRLFRPGSFAPKEKEAF